MLDREVVKEFLNEKFKDLEMDIPNDISTEILTETFCKYVEDDYYEWLNDNFKSFFNHRNSRWDWLRERIVHYSKD